MICFLITTAAIVLIVLVRKPRPAKNKQGQQVSNPNQIQLDSNKEIICIATYNIQAGKNMNGERDISRSAHVIKEADLVGVQEVCAASFLNKLKFGFSQSQALAKLGNFSFLFSATQYRWLQEHRGNAILSKLPILNWQAQMLPTQAGRNYRNMTVIDVEWQNQTFKFMNTHLNTRDGREQQLEFVLNEFAKHPKAILVGDFNTKPNNPLLLRALSNNETVDAIADLKLNNNDENKRIDWILTKGFKLHSGKVIEKGVSDHPCYQVYLSII